MGCRKLSARSRASSSRTTGFYRRSPAYSWSLQCGAFRHCHVRAPLPLMRGSIKPPIRSMPNKAMTLETTRRGLEDLLLPAGADALPIRLIASEDDAALHSLSAAERAWVEAQGWSAK